MREIRAALIALLRESGPAHHQAYIETDGDDPDWPIWYAGYLRDPLNKLLGNSLTTTQYVVHLVEFERMRTVLDPAPDWATFIADQLLALYRER